MPGTNNNLWKSLVVVGIIVLGCGTAIALEEGASSPSLDNTAMAKEKADSNPPGSIDASSDPNLSGSAQIVQTETTMVEQTDQPPVVAQETQQATAQPKSTPDPPATDQQIPTTGDSHSGPETDSSPSQQSAASNPGGTTNTDVKNPSDNKVVTEAPSDHDQTSSNPIPDHPADDHHPDDHSKDKTDKEDKEQDKAKD